MRSFSCPAYTDYTAHTTPISRTIPATMFDTIPENDLRPSLLQRPEQRPLLRPRPSRLERDEALYPSQNAVALTMHAHNSPDHTHLRYIVINGRVFVPYPLPEPLPDALPDARVFPDALSHASLDAHAAAQNRWDNMYRFRDYPVLGLLLLTYDSYPRLTLASIAIAAGVALWNYDTIIELYQSAKERIYRVLATKLMLIQKITNPQKKIQNTQLQNRQLQNTQ